MTLRLRLLYVCYESGDDTWIHCVFDHLDSEPAVSRCTDSLPFSPLYPNLASVKSVNCVCASLQGESFRRELLMDGQYGQICFIATQSDVFQRSDIKRCVYP